METVADQVAVALAARGVERVFGFPGGGSNLALIDALARAGVGFVLTRGEVAAALMAAATAELTSVPGVVLVGNGPGVTSVVNGVAHAQLDRVPLLVISDRFTDDGQSGDDLIAFPNGYSTTVYVSAQDTKAYQRNPQIMQNC